MVVPEELTRPSQLVGSGEGVPGVWRLGGYQGGAIPGIPSRPRLRLIIRYLRYIGSYGRLTEYFKEYLRSEILGSGSWILVLDSGPGSGPGPGPGLASDWSLDRPLRILKLRYTGLEPFYWHQII